MPTHEIYAKNAITQIVMDSTRTWRAVGILLRNPISFVNSGMDIVTTLVIAMSIPSAITGFAFWAIERRIERREKIQDKKDEARKQNEIIVIRGVNAAIALGEATARAVQRIPDAHCNGDMIHFSISPPLGYE